MWIEEWSSLIVLRMPYPKITETGFYLPCCYCQEAELTQTLRKLFVAFFFLLTVTSYEYLAVSQQGVSQTAPHGEGQICATFRL